MGGSELLRPLVRTIAEEAAHLLEDGLLSLRGEARVSSSLEMGAKADSRMAPALAAQERPWISQLSGHNRMAGQVAQSADESTLLQLKKGLTSSDYMELPDDLVAIPSFRVGAQNSYRPYYHVVPKDSEQATLFLATKDSTATILRSRGGGTGFFVTDERLLATANHVIADPEEIVAVQLANKETVPARLIARDEHADLAVLKLDTAAANLPSPLELGRAWDANKLDTSWIISRPASNPVMTGGQIGRFYRENYAGASDWNEKLENIISRLGYTNEGYGGTSGAPVFGSGRKVLAVHTHRNDFAANSGGTDSAHLTVLIDNYIRQTPFSGWLSQNSRSLLKKAERANGTHYFDFDEVLPTSWRLHKAEDFSAANPIAK